MGIDEALAKTVREHFANSVKIAEQGLAQALELGYGEPIGQLSVPGTHFAFLFGNDAVFWVYDETPERVGETYVIKTIGQWGGHTPPFGHTVTFTV